MISQTSWQTSYISFFSSFLLLFSLVSSKQMAGFHLSFFLSIQTESSAYLSWREGDKLSTTAGFANRPKHVNLLFIVDFSSIVKFCSSGSRLTYCLTQSATVYTSNLSSYAAKGWLMHLLFNNQNSQPRK